MPKWLKQRMSMGLAPVIPGGIGRRSDEGHPSAPAAGTEGGQAEGQPATEPGQQPSEDGAPSGDGTDWEAEAKKWEKRAKENRNATEKLAKLEAAAMSEQEKAVAAAKEEGSAEALKKVGVKLATAELRLAAQGKGVDLTKVSKYIDVKQFVDDEGEVDVKAIKAAVADFAEIAPKQQPGKSGAPIPGGSGGKPATNNSLESAVAARYGK